MSKRDYGALSRVLDSLRQSGRKGRAVESEIETLQRLERYTGGAMPTLLELAEFLYAEIVRKKRGPNGYTRLVMQIKRLDADYAHCIGDSYVFFKSKLTIGEIMQIVNAEPDVDLAICEILLFGSHIKERLFPYIRKRDVKDGRVMGEKIHPVLYNALLPLIPVGDDNVYIIGGQKIPMPVVSMTRKIKKTAKRVGVDVLDAIRARAFNTDFLPSIYRYPHKQWDGRKMPVMLKSRRKKNKPNRWQVAWKKEEERLKRKERKSELSVS